MRIEFKNFGQAGSGAVSLADLTVICGPNNSGKTYVNYAVYSALRNFNKFFNLGDWSDAVAKLNDGYPVTIDLIEIKRNFSSYLADAGRNFTKSLDSIFNAPTGFFSGSEFFFHLEERNFGAREKPPISANLSIWNSLECEIESESGIMTITNSTEGLRYPSFAINRFVNDLILEALLAEVVPSPFVITSERTGVALFYKSLDFNNSAIISRLSAAEKTDEMKKTFEMMRSRFAQPIQDNISIVRDYSNIQKRKSFLLEAIDDYQYVFDALNDLLGGGTFRPSGDEPTYYPEKDRSTVDVPMYLASASIKSLFLVDMYINHVARKDQILIIDEPELNLHPDNQVKFARLIARLVNAKVKILLTTHSDYIVREINNLVSMSWESVDTDRLREQYKIIEKDVLSPSQVHAYCADPAEGFSKMNVSRSGIDTTIFDNIISEENVKAQDIYLSIEE